MHPTQGFQWASGDQNGIANMAIDEALLEWVRLQTESTLIVRTYRWSRPTLSLGTHQSDRDLAALVARYFPQPDHIRLVRRPTGGRAILHGDDISFSFISNDPELLNQSLKDSYCTLMQFVHGALEALAIEIACSNEKQETAYTRSAVCFETKTPSDLLNAAGQKIAGCSQLRRKGGLLQHGAAFLKAYPVTPDAFSTALFQQCAKLLGTHTLPPLPTKNDVFKTLLAEQMAAYAHESDALVKSMLTTSGSHLVPASD